VKARSDPAASTATLPFVTVTGAVCGASATWTKVSADAPSLSAKSTRRA
jgi:hypothetical protein